MDLMNPGEKFMSFVKYYLKIGGHILQNTNA